MNSCSGRCKCGRNKLWHEKRDIEVSEANSDEDWKPNDAFTKNVLSDSFGTIEFRGFGHEASRAAPVSNVLL